MPLLIPISRTFLLAEPNAICSDLYESKETENALDDGVPLAVVVDHMGEISNRPT